MQCVSLSDNFPYCNAVRALMHRNDCSTRVTGAIVCSRYSGSSPSTLHTVKKHEVERPLNLNSILKVVISHLSSSATHKHRPFFHGGSLLRKSENCSVNLETNQRYFSTSLSNASMVKGAKDNYDMLSDSDSEDMHIKPALDSVTPLLPPPSYVDIVPGKGPPPEPPVDCCMSGCANCVWIQYAEELKEYFSLHEGNDRAMKAIEQIDNTGLKMFLKLELGLL